MNAREIVALGIPRFDPKLVKMSDDGKSED